MQNAIKSVTITFISRFTFGWIDAHFSQFFTVNVIFLYNFIILLLSKTGLPETLHTI
jgi:hypothetical protein